MPEKTSPPEFIDVLRSDRVSAVTGFYFYALNFLASVAPRLTRSLAQHESEEVRSRIILHCIRDDCRVLREYRPSEGSFDGWFAILCLNKTKDYLKEVGRYRETVIPTGEKDCYEIPPDVSDGPPLPDRVVESSEMLQIVSRCIAMLDPYCRLLVRMAAEEFKPREMVKVLRWPETKAKKVSDDLRYCREKLRQLLAPQGIG